MTSQHSDDNKSSHSITSPLSYRDAGVNIDAGNQLVNAIKPLAQRTFRPGVLTSIGGFGALFEISKKYQNPVLVSGTDGVGTKLKLAFQLNKHASIGIDLVAMSVNDILVSGAEPLFFLDYFACGKLDVEIAAKVVSGIATGCEQAGCALIGGETAEMPDMYPESEYDLAGFAVGVVEKNQIINGTTIQAGDAIIGIASSGAHANGYSLIRKIINAHQIDLSQDFHGKTLSEVIMAPTRIYAKPIQFLMTRVSVKGIAHITGGGLIENLPRVLPNNVTAELHKNAWDFPELFYWLQQQGHVDYEEMLRVFNCGIGMAVIVAENDIDTALDCLQESGEQAYPIGRIKQRDPNQSTVVLI